jgi:hypothetical protein
MSKKYFRPKSPCATPLKTLALETVYSVIQKKHGVQGMARLMAKAHKKGLIRNPKQFRRWITEECINFVNVLDDWLTKNPDPIVNPFPPASSKFSKKKKTDKLEEVFPLTNADFTESFEAVQVLKPVK